MCYIICVRIISGRNRGKKLLLPNFEGTRPTADLVKTSMFGLLNDYIKGAKVLDLFSGSGALGLECYSRYAESVTFVDFNSKAVELTRKNAQSIHYEPEILKLPYEKALQLFKRRGDVFDIVLLDPPYHQGLEAEALKMLYNLKLIHAESICVVEMAKEDIMPQEIYELYEELKNRTFGIKRILLLKPKGIEGAN